MSVSLSITFKTFKYLTLFLTLVGTIDAGVTVSGIEGSGPLGPYAEISLVARSRSSLTTRTTSYSETALEVVLTSLTTSETS